MRDSLTVDTDDHLQAIDITDRVENALPDDADGTVTVRSRHTTTGVVVNGAERRLMTDIETFLADIAPDEGWRHDGIDDNAVTSLRS
jgi:thiamine phosphate synthase YjbQ (UPF0047 family)